MGWALNQTTPFQGDGVTVATVKNAGINLVDYAYLKEIPVTETLPKNTTVARYAFTGDDASHETLFEVKRAVNATGYRYTFTISTILDYIDESFVPARVKRDRMSVGIFVNVGKDGIDKLSAQQIMSALYGILARPFSGTPGTPQMDVANDLNYGILNGF